MTKTLIALPFILLAGCADYRFGDGTRAMINFRQHYCNLAPGPLKDAAHEKAQEFLSAYPESSWCDGIGFAVDVVKEL